MCSLWLTLCTDITQRPSQRTNIPWCFSSCTAVGLLTTHHITNCASVFLPAWSLFHGWERRKSSSDGRDPSSDWTGSGQHEPAHSATSPDAPARGSERRPNPRTSCSCTASPEEPMVKYYNCVLNSTLVLPQLNYEAQWGDVCFLFEKISEKFRYQRVQGNFIYTQRQSKSALQKNDSIWLQKHTNKGLKRRGFKTDLWLITWHVCL